VNPVGSHENKILVAAQQFGWDVEHERNGWIVLTRPPGPMIHRTPRDRICVQLNVGGRLMGAFYGTEGQPYQVPNPLISNVLEMIAR